MTLLYDDGRQGEVNLIASRDSIVHLGNVDFENLTVNLKPKTVAAGEKAVGLGATEAPFGDLYLQGNTLTISTKSIGITEVGGTEYLDFGYNVVIGSTVINGATLLAFQDQLNISSLTDVNITGVEDGNCLKWDNGTSKWIDAEWDQDAENLDVSQKALTEFLDIQPDSYTEGMMWQYSPSVDKWKAFDSNVLEWTDFKVTGAFTVNSEASMSTTRTIQINAGQVVVDSFSINTFTTAKYFISCEDYTTDNKAYWACQATLVHDGTNVNHTIYSEVELGTISMYPGIATDINSGNVRLKITTSSDQQVVTAHRTSITKYTP